MLEPQLKHASVISNNEKLYLCRKL